MFAEYCPSHFVDKWLREKKQELTRQTTPESWHRIVESLNNRSRRAIVTDDRENTSVLMLAGPGSGKTRVLVHRIAYLIRARGGRIPAQSWPWLTTGTPPYR